VVGHESGPSLTGPGTQREDRLCRTRTADLSVFS